MSLIETINRAAMDARKSAMKASPGAEKEQRTMAATLIVGIQSDIKSLQKSATKNGVMPSIDDEMCMRALRSALKGQEETLRLAQEADQNSRIPEIREKIELIKGLMPTAASEEDVRKEIEAILARTEPTKGLMGVIMRELNDRFGTSLDRSMASKLAKSMTGK